jgi:ATP-binding cassette, subfamily C, type I secretion system permease/ATPase
MSWLFARQLRPFVVLAGAAGLVLNLALLAPALYMLQVFDRVFASRSFETLVMLSLAAALALILAYFMDTVRAAALSWAGRALERRLSPAALGSVLRDAAAPSGRADSDVLRDIGQLRSFLAGSGIHAFFDAPWVPIYVMVIGLMHPVLGLTAALGACLLAAIALATEKLTHEPVRQVLERTRATTRHAEALARNAEVIVGMGMTSAAVSAWQAGQEKLLEAQARSGGTTARLGALARVARQGLQVAMLGVGAWLVIGLDASAGIMVAATILFGRALQPLEHLIGGWKSMVGARSAWQRLGANTVAHADRPRLELPAPSGRLELERIMFAPAANRPALIKKVSFSLEPGESLGIIGPSASGKTTLIRLMLGLWKPQAGVIRLDGADVALWDRDSLGQHVGYLPQDVELFAGTVAENIARLAAVDSHKVVEAARLAHAHEMILRLPQGYETEIGQAGGVLSGGQRQRIALARALYGDPRVVMLDEPNASLDAEGERALSDALAELKARGTTVVLVGHRPAMMSAIDKLAVLNEGVLEAFGPAPAVLARLRAVAHQPRQALAAS